MNEREIAKTIVETWEEERVLKCIKGALADADRTLTHLEDEDIKFAAGYASAQIESARRFLEVLYEKKYGAKPISTLE